MGRLEGLPILPCGFGIEVFSTSGERLVGSDIFQACLNGLKKVKIAGSRTEKFVVQAHLQIYQCGLAYRVSTRFAASIKGGGTYPFGAYVPQFIELRLQKVGTNLK